MTLTLYLSRLFASRFGSVLLALTALVELIEMLEAMRRLMGPAGGMTAVMVFTVLKLPLVMERLFPIAVLLGAVLTFRTLAHNSEITILRSAGLSPYRLQWCLVPVTVLMAVGYFVLVDRLAPAAERVFTDWWQSLPVVAADETGDKTPGLIWLRAGRDVVSVGNVLDKGRTVTDLVRYRRDGDGMLIERVRADSAQVAGHTWHLSGVEILTLENGQPRTRHVDGLEWSPAPSPANLHDVDVPTDRQTGSRARKILNGTWSGVASRAHYQTLIQKGYCTLALPFLMVFLAMSALAGGRRTGGLAKGTVTALVLGLSFLVINGFFLSMSEAGALPAVLAVWAGPLIFAALGGTFFLQSQE